MTDVINTNLLESNMSSPALDGARIQGLRPVRPLTEAEIDSFWRDGVVKLEQVLPLQASDFLRDVFEEIFGDVAAREKRMMAAGFTDFYKQGQDLEAQGEGGRLLIDGGTNLSQATGRFQSEVNCARWNTDFRRWALDGPLPEVVAQLMRTKRLQLHNDQLFYKEKGSLMRTGFHQDGAFFSMAGEQVAICWVPCDLVTKDSGAMGYVVGSHLWRNGDGKREVPAGVIFQPKNLVTEQSTQALKEFMPHMPEMPDIERNEQDYDVIYYDAKPGDVIVHHARLLHGSAGNTSDRHRRAASVRYIGDDVVFAIPEANKAGTRMVDYAFATTSRESKAAKKIASGQTKPGASGMGGQEGSLVPGSRFSESDYPLAWPKEEASTNISAKL